MEKALLFVYGTLCRGEPNHFYLDGAELLCGSCWTRGRLYDTGHGYPAMLPDEHGLVYGELYRVEDGQLARIDRLEGYLPGGRSLYVRARQPVFTGDKEIVAFVYLYARGRKGLVEIPSGNWLERTK